MNRRKNTHQTPFLFPSRHFVYLFFPIFELGYGIEVGVSAREEVEVNPTRSISVCLIGLGFNEHINLDKQSSGEVEWGAIDTLARR